MVQVMAVGDATKCTVTLGIVVGEVSEWMWREMTPEQRADCATHVVRKFVAGLVPRPDTVDVLEEKREVGYGRQ